MNDNKESVNIRRVCADDYLALYDVYQQPKVIRGTLQMPMPSLEVWRKRCTESPEGWMNLVACIDDKPVGNIGLSHGLRPRRKHAAQVVMAVHDDWQGRGIGSSLLHAALDLADNWIGATRVELEVFVDNAPAVRLYERFGFKTEGRLRQYALCDGVYTDALAMARLR